MHLGYYLMNKDYFLEIFSSILILALSVAWLLPSFRLPVLLSLTSRKEFTSCFEQDFVTSCCFTILVLSFTSSSRCIVLCNFIFMFCFVFRNWITCFITSFVSLFQHHTSYHMYTTLILLFPLFL